MGFAGATYQIPCDRGGFTFNKNLDLVEPFMFVMPSRNINLHQNGRGKRGGTTKVNSTAVSGGPQILGLFDFQLAASSFQMFAATDGKIYKNTTSAIKTGMSTTNKYNFSVFDQEVYICDGANTPQTWDGAAANTSDITTPAADWSTTQPIQMVAHGRNASRRMWAIAGSAVYYSKLNDGKDWTHSSAGKITIDTEDAYGLVGMIEFGNRLVVFGRKKTWIIVDDDTSTANWGYEAAQWSGGAAHWRGLIKLENDILVLADDAQLYSITGAQEYGDYRVASLTRPSYIDNYIRENISLSDIDDFHAVYDRTLRAVKIFVVRSGQTTIDTALVFFIDRGAKEGWTVHDNQDSSSGYSASASAEVRTGAGQYVIYTGDYSGFLWKLEQSTRSDDSAAYYGGFKTVNLNLENSRLRKHFRQLRCVMEAVGNYDLQISVWVDGEVQSGLTINMGSSGAVLGSFVLGTDVLGGVEFIDGRVDLNFVGKRIQFEFYNSGANQDFFISHILLDFQKVPATV